MMIDLGINSGSIKYEVALEVLGQEQQIFLNAINQEQLKDNPSQVLINYFQARFNAINELQTYLHNDPEIVNQILDQNNHMFRV